MKKLLFGFLTAYLMFSISGCGKEKKKNNPAPPGTPQVPVKDPGNPPPNPSNPPNPEVARLEALQGQVKGVLQASCARCHYSGQKGGGLDLTVKSQIADYKEEIVTEIENRGMPRGGQLSDQQIKYFSDWKAANYPLNLISVSYTAGGGGVNVDVDVDVDGKNHKHIFKDFEGIKEKVRRFKCRFKKECKDDSYEQDPAKDY